MVLTQAIANWSGECSRPYSADQQQFDCAYEFGGAFDEFGGFLRARRCGLVVAFLAGGFGSAG